MGKNNEETVLKDKVKEKMQKVDLPKYFEIISPRQVDKINFETSSLEQRDAIPFLGRSSINNGITDYVMPNERLINQGNVISIALDGSTGSTFYQRHDFYSGQNIWLLIPKREYLSKIDAKLMLYFVTTIRRGVESYVGHYNLALTKTRLSNIKIYLPLNEDETIDTNYIEDRFKKIRNINLLDNISDERL